MTLTAETIRAAKTPFDRDPRADSGSRDAYRYYKGNPAMASVWRKGALAAAEGRPLRDVPYDDARTDRGAVTFSRAFIKAWCEGWHYATFDGESRCKLNPWHGGPCQT